MRIPPPQRPKRDQEPVPPSSCNDGLPCAECPFRKNGFCPGCRGHIRYCIQSSCIGTKCERCVTHAQKQRFVPSVCGRSPLLQHFYNHFVILHNRVEQMLETMPARGPLPPLPKHIPYVQYMDVGLIGLFGYKAVAIHIDRYDPRWLPEVGMKTIHELLGLDDDCVVIQMLETVDDYLEQRWPKRWWEGLAESGVTLWEHLVITGYWNVSRAHALYNCMRAMYDFLESGAQIYIPIMLDTPFLVELGKRVAAKAAAARLSFTTLHSTERKEDLRINLAALKLYNDVVLPEGQPVLVYGSVDEMHPLRRYVEDVMAQKHPIHWIEHLTPRGWKSQMDVVRQWRRRVLIPVCRRLRETMYNGKPLHIEPDDKLVETARRIVDTAWDVPKD